jgi:hypothetical protein
VLEVWADRARNSPPFSLFYFVARLATPIPLVPEADRMGFGPGVLLMVPLGVMGAVQFVRRRCALPVWVLAALSLGIAIPQLSAPWLWITDIASVQRYVLGIYAALAVAAATIDRPWARRALAGVAVLGAVLALPRGVGPAEREALWAALAALGLGAGAIGAGALLLHRGRAGWASAVALAGGLACLALLAPIRARIRHDVYRDAWLKRSFDPHFLHPALASAWPIWRGLDDVDRPRTLAVTAGYDPYQNWYWYPLLGAALQNRAIYVPITADGSLVDYLHPAEAREKGSYPAWLRRLVDAGVDELVLLAPDPPEAAWVDAAPELFEPHLEATDGASRAFRFRADRARAALGSGQRR